MSLISVAKLGFHLFAGADQEDFVVGRAGEFFDLFLVLVPTGEIALVAVGGADVPLGRLEALVVEVAFRAAEAAPSSGFGIGRADVFGDVGERFFVFQAFQRFLGVGERPRPRLRFGEDQEATRIEEFSSFFPRGQRAADADHRQRFEAEPEDPARRAEPLGRRRTRRRRGFQRLARLERRSGAAGRGLFAAEGGADQGVVAGPVEPVPDSGGAAEAAEGVAEGFPGRDVAGQVGVRLWRAERLQEQAAAVVFGGDRFQPAGDRAQGAHFFAAALQREGAAERGDPFQRRVEGGDRDPRRGPFEFVGVLLAADLGGDRAAAPGLDVGVEFERLGEGEGEVARGDRAVDAAQVAADRAGRAGADFVAGVFGDQGMAGVDGREPLGARAGAVARGAGEDLQVFGAVGMDCLFAEAGATGRARRDLGRDDGERFAVEHGQLRFRLRGFDRPVTDRLERVVFDLGLPFGPAVDRPGVEVEAVGLDGDRGFNRHHVVGGSRVGHARGGRREAARARRGGGRALGAAEAQGDLVGAGAMGDEPRPGGVRPQELRRRGALGDARLGDDAPVVVEAFAAVGGAGVGAVEAQGAAGGGATVVAGGDQGHPPGHRHGARGAVPAARLGVVGEDDDPVAARAQAVVGAQRQRHRAARAGRPEELRPVAVDGEAEAGDAATEAEAEVGRAGVVAGELDGADQSGGAAAEDEGPGGEDVVPMAPPSHRHRDPSARQAAQRPRRDPHSPGGALRLHLAAGDPDLHPGDAADDPRADDEVLAGDQRVLGR